jgi:2-phosphosulfolactate phosphatase
MSASLEVLFTPAEFALLPGRDLSRTVCVVFDVLRATSSMVTALSNGAEAIRPVSDIEEAVACRNRDPNALLAGERDGLRIEARLTGSIGFDLGNSPREFTREKVHGKKIAMTTTNGTRALKACAHAQTVLIGSFLNLKRTAEAAQSIGDANLVIVCSGTFEEAALEDVLGAGALCQLVAPWRENGQMADSAIMARSLFQQAQGNLLSAISASRNGRRLLSRPELKDDVGFCAQRDLFDFAAELGQDGWVRMSPPKKVQAAVA